MKRTNYKRLEIYQRSLQMAKEIMNICDAVRPYRLSEQLAGSCLSVPSNIAEGSCRSSKQDFARFLEYSSGSLAELETQLLVLQAKDKENKEEIIKWLNEIENLHPMVEGFRLYILRNP